MTVLLEIKAHVRKLRPKEMARLNWFLYQVE